MEIVGDAMMASIVKPSDNEPEVMAKSSAGPGSVESVISVLKKHERLIEERRQRERSRFSEERQTQTDDGTTWGYVVVDREFLRLTACETPCDVLELPAELDGMPVAELGVQACANLENVREIICSSGIEFIGANAFRGCARLEKLVLPPNITRFDASWIAQCRRLAELVCPTMLTTLDSGVFEAENLELLTVGVATHHVEPGAFAKSKLTELRVPAQNPYIATDGNSLFTKDFDELIAVAVPCVDFELPHGCRYIASKAFASCPNLEHVTLADTVESIGTHAFARTAVREIDAPATLRIIERRAFYRCRKLAFVRLREGLLEIGDEAFAGTALAQLELPASLTSLSHNSFAGTGLTFAAERGTCSIAPGGSLHLDRFGALYREDGDSRGKELLCMLGETPSRYVVEDNTQYIAQKALMRDESIREIVFPEGLIEIGESAFQGCKNLHRATFPESLRAVGASAFLNTTLEEVYLPAQFETLGELALVTFPAYEGDAPTTIHSVRVNPNCERFYFTEGLLCERTGKGASRVVLFDDSRESVRIPSEVTDICAYAFSGVSMLRELYISTHVAHIGPKSLNIGGPIEHLFIGLEPPVQGHTELDLHFPPTLRSANEVARGFNTCSFINPEKILARYDACVVNMHDYDAKNADPMDLYGQVKRIVGRLKDPLFLTENTRSMYERVFKDNLEEMCIAIARHDDRAAIDALVELGFLNKDNILGIIDSVGRLQDAAMTGYLLEVQRRLYGVSAIDFDL